MAAISVFFKPWFALATSTSTHYIGTETLRKVAREVLKA